MTTGRTLIALALVLTACGEEDPTHACGDNATVDEASGACVCDAGFDDVDGVCTDERFVPCADDAPDGATSADVFVTITYADGAWSEPAACPWDCDDGLDEVGGACVDTRTVPCADDAPANATSEAADVEITFDGDAWSAPAACDWTCDAGFDEIDGACLDTRSVPCVDDAPDNAVSDDTLVTVTFDGEAWSEPATCGWS